MTNERKSYIMKTMKDKRRGFWEIKSHGCIFGVPQVDGFFRVLSQGKERKSEEKSPLNKKNAEQEEIWLNSSLL